MPSTPIRVLLGLGKKISAKPPDTTTIDVSLGVFGQVLLTQQLQIGARRPVKVEETTMGNYLDLPILPYSVPCFGHSVKDSVVCCCCSVKVNLSLKLHHRLGMLIISDG